MLSISREEFVEKASEISEGGYFPMKMPLSI
jgi:hypothetical protein